MEELVIAEKPKKARKPRIPKLSKNNNDIIVLPEVQFTELSGMWHRTRTYPIQYEIKNNGRKPFVSHMTLKVCGVITGCGLVQMHGISNISEHNFELVREKLETIKKDYKKDGAGCIMCTLGQSYYNKEELVLSLGFIMVSEYANYRHGQDGKYKQRMYLLTY